jgi:hypothetical protein
MGFGVGFKVAPGVRVRASSRGIRTSVGPRGARLHVGAGRTSFSSGVGPVSVSTTFGGRGPAPQPRRPTVAQLEREARQAERMRQIADLARIEQALVTVHHEAFAPAARIVLPPPPPIDPSPLERELRNIHLGALGFLEWSRRRQVRLWAKHAALERARQIGHHRLTEHQRLQRQADEQWEALLRHDPAAVMSALEAAYEDNQAPAACLDVGTGNGVRYATVIVLFPHVDAIPEKRSALTPTGRPTMKARSKTDRNDLYLAALGSTVLATVREGLAVAPSVQEFRLIAVRRSGHRLEPIFAGRFPRTAFDSITWERLDPAGVLTDLPDSMVRRVGRTGEVVALDLAAEPELADLISAVSSGLAG